MINVGVLGYGYWGPNLVRNFSEVSGSQVTNVADLSEKRLELVKSRYPAINVTNDIDELLNNNEVDAVAIATPVSTHYDLAMKALNAGKHVLVEKPLADSAEKCQEMIDLAQSKGKVLMVDHTFPYTGAVKKIKELIQTGELGDIYYYDSSRVNLGLFQHDVSVIWDLAVHDLSIAEFLFPNKPIAVSACGMSHVTDAPANVAYLTVFYSENMIAHINVNWLAPVKLRQTLVGGSKKMVVYDDLDMAARVKVYDKGITVSENVNDIHKMMVGYRTGDIWAPKLDGAEALKGMAEEFLRCIDTGDKPITNAESGMRIVKIMEAASKSLENRGSVVELS